jgi:predicted ATPase
VLTDQTVVQPASCIDDHRLLHAITLQNLLSFGPDTPALPLMNLNVLIGTNGSGKSNLIEALALLRATPVRDRPGDLLSVIERGGGVNEWIWKGNPRNPAVLDAVFCNPDGAQPLRHSLSFRAENQFFRLDDERIENEQPYPGQQHPHFYYRYQRGRPTLNTKGKERQLEREYVEPDFSILAQRRDPESYPEISFLADTYGKIRLYREWAFGRNTVFRESQKADLRNDRLEEDFSNLGLFLNRLSRFPKAKSAILAGLRDFYECFSDFNVIIQGGTVQVFFTEKEFSIPAVRLSDGTVRYLCLLAILCDPEPPPLICIEEPELGLHPDVLHKLADLLVSTSERTQLIVTTHSDILVDAMTERPETVLVCEHHDDRTVVERLSHEKLSGWLEQYRLGQLWTKGQIGGTRW